MWTEIAAAPPVVSPVVPEPVKKKRGRPKGSKNKPKFVAPPVIGKARADFHCEKCGEMYVLPVSAKACPDSDCGGVVARIWAGSPPGVKSDATNLVDRVVGSEYQVAKAAIGGHDPGFATKHGGVSPGGALGMVGAEGRVAARMNWGLLGNGGGPRPNWAR